MTQTRLLVRMEVTMTHEGMNAGEWGFCCPRTPLLILCPCLVVGQLEGPEHRDSPVPVLCHAPQSHRVIVVGKAPEDDRVQVFPHPWH